MKIQNKKYPKSHITVLSNRKGIIVTKGFVTITKGDHYGHSTIRSDLLKVHYIIPEGVQILD